MTKIGFTGTQTGLSAQQKMVLTGILNSVGPIGMFPNEFHHGCCIGADSESHYIAKEVGLHIVLHPPTNLSKADTTLVGDEERRAKDYLARNHDIVNESSLLIACPKGPEELRSGTWATVRYARKQKKQLIIIFPDGSTTSS